MIKFGSDQGSPSFSIPNTIIFTPKPLRPPKSSTPLSYLPVKIKSFVERPHFHKKYEEKEQNQENKDKQTEMPCFVEKPLPTYEELQKEMYDNEGKINIPLIWMAPFKSGGGYCSEAISFVEYLLEEMKKIRIIHWGDAINNDFVENVLPKKLFPLFDNKIRAPEAIVVCHCSPPSCKEKLESIEKESSATRFSVIRTMFETDRINQDWVDICNSYDEVWVPSKFNKETFIKSGVKKNKIYVVGESVDSKFFNPELATPLDLFKFEEEPPEKKPFIFLSIFKWEYRKGWDILLNSYFSEFTSSDDCILVILTNPYNSDEEYVMQEIIEFTRAKGIVKELDKVPKVWVSFDKITNEELRDLYRTADSFVLPSRGEGWGRPYVEAMAMGLPVIATDWSGQTEYMNSENSYLIKVKQLIPVPFGGDYAGHSYAEPCPKHLGELMRHVYSNRKEAKRIGYNARKTMVDNYKENDLGKIILDRIKVIYEKMKNDDNLNQQH